MPLRRRIPRSAIMGAKTKALYYRKARYLKKRGADQRLATIGKVKKMIHQNAETKLVGYSWNGYKNQTITVSTADVLPLLPQVAQGVTDNQRLGNRINPRGILVNVTVTLSKRIDTTNYPPGSTVMPRIMCLEQKSNRDLGGLLAGGIDASHLLDYGTGEHGFTGGLYDYTSPINKEAFIVHKDIKTKISTGTNEYDQVVCKTFKFWIKCPKQLTYNDNQNYPKNFAPFMCVGFANPDNTIADTAPLLVTYTSTLYFEDE